MEINEVAPPGTGDAFTSRRAAKSSLSDLAEKHLRLLDGPVPAILATRNVGGAAQLSPIWLLRDGETLLINSARGRLKDRNLRRDPQVSLCVVDPDDHYRYLSVQGTVIEIVDEDDPLHGDRSTRAINDMAKLYMDQDVYPLRSADDEVRSLFVVRVDRVSTFN